MDIVVLGVNYRSASFAEAFARAWSAQGAVKKVYIVDNYSSDEEVRAIEEVARRTGAEALFRPNDGYGAALNHGLAHVLETHAQHALVLFGNVDVLPVSLKLPALSDSELPQLRVLQGGSDNNPFLSRAQKLLVPLLAIPVRVRSATLLWLWIAANKLMGVVPASTWAVHGAMFGATLDQLRNLLPIFDPGTFLYCEELSFAARAEALGYRFRKTQLTVSHVGSVSTAAIKSSRGAHFDIWTKSMRRFLDRDVHSRDVRTPAAK